MKKLPTNIKKDMLGRDDNIYKTCMSTLVKDGVVNTNQKIFDIDNLYVLGTSVFLIRGHTNPTFSIAQRSLEYDNYMNNIGTV